MRSEGTADGGFGYGAGGSPSRGPAGAPEPGTVLADRYVLQRTLGRGGMGVVWEARDTRLERQVAVKGLMPRGAPEGGTQSPWVARARREAQALARIGHRNVVAVHDVIEAGSQVWIVMELLDSRSLADLLGEALVPVGRAARIGLQVLRGLRAAHEAGVLHRDVKPANVLFRSDGRALLMDFGGATFEGALQVTNPQDMVGTPHYFAPELVGVTLGDPGKPTPACDLWSLGVTLYEAVEGRRPFTGESVREICLAVRDAPVPPMQHAGPLGAVIEAMLQKDPERRASAAQVEEMLRAVLGEAPVEPVSPPPDAREAGRPKSEGAGTGGPRGGSSRAPEPEEGPAPQRRLRGWRLPVAAAVAVALCLGVLGSVLWLRDDSPADASSAKPGTSKDVPYKKEHPQLKVGVKEKQPGLSERTGTRTVDGVKRDVYEGFEIDLAYEIADKMGYQRKDVRFLPVTSRNRGTKLASDKADLVLATYSINEDRKKQEEKQGVEVAMVGPYYNAERALMVRSKHRNRFKDPNDLVNEGAEVCTAKDSTYPKWLEKQGYTVKTFDFYETCLDELQKEDPGNKIYAVGTDDVILQGFRQKAGNKDKFAMLDTLGGQENWGVAMKRIPRDSKSRLDHEVCTALKGIVKGGTWEQLYMKHLYGIMDHTSPNLPTVNRCDTTGQFD